VLGIDYPAAREDVLARLRSLMAQSGVFAAAIRELDRAIKLHFETEPPCCEVCSHGMLVPEQPGRHGD